MKVQLTDAFALNSNQFAIIKLGRVAGKVKYSLLDVTSLWILDYYVLQAHLHIDPNGMGAAVFVKYHARNETLKPDNNVHFLHHLLWCHYFGSVPADKKVTHKNGITVDNRLENLMLVPGSTQPLQLSLPLLSSKYNSPAADVSPMEGPEENMAEDTASEQEKSLYYQTIRQLTLQVEKYQEQQRSTAIGAVTDLEHIEEGSYLYECRYAPCCSLEQEYRQFRICGQCRRARYCSTFCQRNDWDIHKQYCIAVLPPSLITLVAAPDR